MPKARVSNLGKGSCGTKASELCRDFIKVYTTKSHLSSQIK